MDGINAVPSEISAPKLRKTESKASPLRSNFFASQPVFIVHEIESPRHAYERAGWHFCDDIDWIKVSLDVENAFQTEASQEPEELALITVDMSRRFAAMASSSGTLFYQSRLVFIALALSCGYMFIPCAIPTDFLIFLFVNRNVYGICASLAMISTTLLFLRVEIATPAVLIVAVILYSAMDLVKFVFLQPIFSTSFSYLEAFNSINYTLMLFLFQYWTKLGCTVITGQFWAVCITFYVYLLVITMVAVQVVSDQGPLIQTLIFACFFAWCTLCQRLFQSLCRRIVVGIAIRENRPVEWFDLVRGQCIMALPYSIQGAYYRLIFVAVDRWYMVVILIAMHVAQELILYPLRALPTVREWERSILSRSRLGRRILFPVLPMSVNIDMHCFDYTLRKVADVTTLLLFVVRCVICRNLDYLSSCFSPATWSDEQYKSLLILSAAVLVTECASGAVGYYMMSKVGRGFVTRAVMEVRHLRVFFGLMVIVTSCSVTYADALRHVKF